MIVDGTTLDTLTQEARKRIWTYGKVVSGDQTNREIIRLLNLGDAMSHQDYLDMDTRSYLKGVRAGTITRGEGTPQRKR